LLDRVNGVLKHILVIVFVHDLLTYTRSVRWHRGRGFPRGEAIVSHTLILARPKIIVKLSFGYAKSEAKTLIMMGKFLKYIFIFGAPIIYNSSSG